MTSHYRSALPFFLLIASSAFAQIEFGGRAIGLTHPDRLQPPPLITLPAVDVAALIAEDEARSATGVKGPWRFGFNHEVDLGLDQGIWQTLDNGDRLWRMAIESPGAYSINFEFHDYIVPQGAQVFVYNEDGDQLGAFTQESSGGQHSMGVTQIAGDRITIEYFEPAEIAGEGSLRIGQVTHAYRDVLGKMRGLGDSGSCNNNVICPVGDPWRDQIRSVAMITVGGSGICTGTLLNNCDNDGTPYFLTADHCLPPGNNVSNWVFRFNWESPVCAQNQNGPTTQTVSGASLKVNNGATDVALLELNSAPPASYDVFFSGWNRSSTPATSATAIHHPSGDIKKISFENQPVTPYSLGGPNNFWRVAAWDDGTTEPGSSGSGLWDQNGLLVGQLYGGEASCGYNFNDWYGRFDISYPHLEQWLGDCGTQLQGHPISIGVEEISDRADISIFPNPAVSSITIEFPNAFTEDLVILIHDPIGRTVRSGTVRGGSKNAVIVVDGLNVGLYLLEIRGKDLHAFERVMIER